MKTQEEHLIIQTLEDCLSYIEANMDEQARKEQRIRTGTTIICAKVIMALKALNNYKTESEVK